MSLIDYSKFKPDHRMMPVPRTPKMLEIAQQISDLQEKYNELEQREQRRALNAYLKGVRERAVNRWFRY